MKTRTIVFLALGAALVCLISPISISVWTIPITLSIFIISLIGMLFKPLYSLVIILVYILIGLIGLPVFSNFTGGAGVLLGVTGGYIIGYLPFVLIISAFTKKENHFIINFLYCLLALLICYLIGSIWFMFQTKNNFLETLMITVVPYVIFDFIKIILALLITLRLQTRINFGLLGKQ